MNQNQPSHKLANILGKADRKEVLKKEDIAFLLQQRQTGQINAIFQAARKLRYRHFGERVFLCGFIYISTFCRNNCSFCYYRSANTQIER